MRRGEATYASPAAAIQGLAHWRVSENVVMETEDTGDMEPARDVDDELRPLQARRCSAGDRAHPRAATIVHGVSSGGGRRLGGSGVLLNKCA